MLYLTSFIFLYFLLSLFASKKKNEEKKMMKKKKKKKKKKKNSEWNCFIALLEFLCAHRIVCSCAHTPILHQNINFEAWAPHYFGRNVVVVVVRRLCSHHFHSFIGFVVVVGAVVRQILFLVQIILLLLYYYTETYNRNRNSEPRSISLSQFSQHIMYMWHIHTGRICMCIYAGFEWLEKFFSDAFIIFFFFRFFLIFCFYIFDLRSWMRSLLHFCQFSSYFWNKSYPDKTEIRKRKQKKKTNRKRRVKKKMDSKFNCDIANKKRIENNQFRVG